MNSVGCSSCYDKFMINLEARHRLLHIVANASIQSGQSWWDGGFEEKGGQPLLPIFSFKRFRTLLLRISMLKIWISDFERNRTHAFQRTGYCWNRGKKRQQDDSLPYFWPSFSVAVYLLIIHIEKNNDNLHSYSAKTDFIRILKRFTKFVIETKI